MRYTEKDWKELAEQGKYITLVEIRSRLRKRARFADNPDEMAEKLKLLEEYVHQADIVSEQAAREAIKQRNEAEPEIQEIKAELEEAINQIKQKHSLITGVTIGKYVDTSIDIKISLNL